MQSDCRVQKLYQVTSREAGLLVNQGRQRALNGNRRVSLAEARSQLMRRIIRTFRTRNPAVPP